MVNCFDLSAVEMQGMGHWFSLDHQVQIKKNHSKLLVCNESEEPNVQFCIFPDEKDLGSHVFPYSQRERGREKECGRGGGRGGNRNGG